VLLNGDRITDENCNNAAFYSNPEVNRRLAVAGDSLEPEERLRLYRGVESLVMRDAPWVPLYHSQIAIICNPACGAMCRIPSGAGVTRTCGWPSELKRK